MTKEKLNLEFYVAGVKFRKDWKKNLVVLEEGWELELVPEPDNRFDPFAVKILNFKEVGDSTTLGYVPAKTGEAKIVSTALNDGKMLRTTIIDLSPDFEPWQALKVRIEEVDIVPTTGSPEDGESRPSETRDNFEPRSEEG